MAQLTHTIWGRKVTVYADPLTRQNKEGVATVKRILQTPEQTGVAGQYYVEVAFVGERARYRRFVNQADVFGA